MDQITGALLGIALVLSAVLIPMAFFGGSTGVIYRQFSITIVSAMSLSVLVALTLTPALCASILKPHSSDRSTTARGLLARFERGFNNLSTRYQAIVARVLPQTPRMMLAYLALVGLMALLYVHLPTSFLPEEDQGALLAMAKLPPGATLDRTVAAQHQLELAMLADTGSVATCCRSPDGASAATGRTPVCPLRCCATGASAARRTSRR